MEAAQQMQRQIKHQQAESKQRRQQQPPQSAAVPPPAGPVLVLDVDEQQGAQLGQVFGNLQARLPFPFLGCPCPL